jgi:hypothetical protein
VQATPLRLSSITTISFRSSRATLEKDNNFFEKINDTGKTVVKVLGTAVKVKSKL